MYINMYIFIFTLGINYLFQPGRHFLRNVNESCPTTKQNFLLVPASRLIIKLNPCLSLWDRKIDYLTWECNY